MIGKKVLIELDVDSSLPPFVGYGINKHKGLILDQIVGKNRYAVQILEPESLRNKILQFDLHQIKEIIEENSKIDGTFTGHYDHKSNKVLVGSIIEIPADCMFLSSGYHIVALWKGEYITYNELYSNLDTAIKFTLDYILNSVKGIVETS